MATTRNKLAKLTWTLVLWLLPWGPLACGGKVSSTNTNFDALEDCDTTAQCGSGLACRCGACTVECTSDADCEFEGVHGMCATDDACESVALCVRRLFAQPGPTKEELDAGPSPSEVVAAEPPSPLPPEAVVPECGNQRFEPGAEECDRTANDDPTPHASCNPDCTLSVCGDGKLGQDEVCDPKLTPACADHCSVLEDCGNGVIDDGEQCDSASETGAIETCAPNCTAPGCGNGYTDQGEDFNEVCDDGNNVSGDGCSVDCLSDETCGNGVVDSANGEVCDDGNATSGDGCSSTCRSREACGDGYVDYWGVREACDDGNTTSGDGCSSDCLSIEVCGNGYVDLATGEHCDTLGEDSTVCNGLTAGPLACKFGNCGDGYLNTAAGEQCDHGGLDTSSCDADCSPATCGDGYVNAAAGEECDLPSPWCNGPSAGMFACRTTRCGDGYCSPESEYGGPSDPDAGTGEYCPADCE